MNIEINHAAVMYRVQLAQALGVGPLWVPREAHDSHESHESHDSHSDHEIPSPPKNRDTRGAVAPAAQGPQIPGPSATRPLSGTPRDLPPDARRAGSSAVGASTAFADAAWVDDAPAVDGATADGTPLRVIFTLCSIAEGTASALLPAASPGALSQFLFATRPTSADGAEELFGNMLRAMGLQKEIADARNRFDVPGTFDDAEQLIERLQDLTVDRPTMLVLMEPAAAFLLAADGLPDINEASGAVAASERFDRLRGCVHQIAGMPAVVTYGPAHLVRNRLDKRKAWEDLCLMLAYRGEPR